MAGGIGGAAAPGGVNISGVAAVQAAADDIEGLCLVAGDVHHDTE
jgi:hypothetical protein